jgi:hypothetical protein
MLYTRCHHCPYVFLSSKVCFSVPIRSLRHNVTVTVIILIVTAAEIIIKIKLKALTLLKVRLTR